MRSSTVDFKFGLQLENINRIFLHNIKASMIYYVLISLHWNTFRVNNGTWSSMEVSHSIELPQQMFSGKNKKITFITIFDNLI